MSHKNPSVSEFFFVAGLARWSAASKQKLTQGSNSQVLPAVTNDFLFQILLLMAGLYKWRSLIIKPTGAEISLEFAEFNFWSSQEIPKEIRKMMYNIIEITFKQTKEGYNFITIQDWDIDREEK